MANLQQTYAKLTLHSYAVRMKQMNAALARISKSKQLEIYREDWLPMNFLGLSWLKPTNPAQNCARDTMQHPA